MAKEEEKDPKIGDAEASLEFDITSIFQQVDPLHDSWEKVEEWVRDSFPEEMRTGILASIKEARNQED